MYDPNKAERLSTYASFWIHHYIICSLAKFSGSLSLPMHTIAEIKFIDRVEQKLFQTLNRVPTQDEIICAVLEASNLKRAISENRIIDLIQLKQ
jgi:DNA-directed RNA polymerase sigma subunit (sigma70/sigma32)